MGDAALLAGGFSVAACWWDQDYLMGTERRCVCVCVSVVVSVWPCGEPGNLSKVSPCPHPAFTLPSPCLHPAFTLWQRGEAPAEPRPPGWCRKKQVLQMDGC